MKRLFNYSSILLMLLSVVSCTNNDNDDTVLNSGNYFPLTLDNYWNYNVTNSNLDLNQTQNTRDSLFVSSVNNNAFDLTITGIAKGTMNTILTQMQLSRTSFNLMGSGNIIFPFEGLDDLQIGVNNAIFYNTNSPSDETLSSVDGVIEQNIEGLPIMASYNLKTIQGPFSDSLFLNNVNYDNVIESSILLQLTITTRIEVIPGNFVDVLILDTQNVLDIKNHYVKDIGLVRSEAIISYNLEDFSQIGITLPLAGSLNASSIQALDTYEVAEE